MTTVLLLQPWPFPPTTPNPTLQYLLPGLVQRGYRFRVVAPVARSAIPSPPGIQVFTVPFRFRAHRLPRDPGHLWYLWELARWNRRLVAFVRQRPDLQRPALVLGLSGAVAPATGLLARTLGVPGVLKLFGVTYFLRYRPTLRQWLWNRENLLAARARVSGMIVVEDGTGGKQALRRQGFQGEIWLEPQAFPDPWPAPGRWTRERLGVPPEAQVLLVVSRLAAIKGVRFLPDLLKHLDPRLPWHLVLAGDGPERSWLARRFQQMGLAHRVHFLGTVPHAELPDLYRLAWITLGISPVANVTLPVVESLALGVPVVAFDVQETGQILQTPAVRRIPPFELETFARAIERWFRHPEERHQAAREARAFAHRRFLTWTQVVEMEHRIFQHLIRHASA